MIIVSTTHMIIPSHGWFLILLPTVSTNYDIQWGYKIHRRPEGILFRLRWWSVCFFLRSTPIFWASPWAPSAMWPQPCRSLTPWQTRWWDTSQPLAAKDGGGLGRELTSGDAPGIFTQKKWWKLGCKPQLDGEVGTYVYIYIYICVCVCVCVVKVSVRFS